MQDFSNTVVLYYKINCYSYSTTHGITFKYPDCKTTTVIIYTRRAPKRTLIIIWE
jgi:hypothetical protein